MFRKASHTFTHHNALAHGNGVGEHPENSTRGHGRHRHGPVIPARGKVRACVSVFFKESERACVVFVLGAPVLWVCVFSAHPARKLASVFPVTLGMPVLIGQGGRCAWVLRRLCMNSAA